MDSLELKKNYPLYPTVRRTQEKGKVVNFTTLLRKRLVPNSNVYYLMPLEFSGVDEAKIIHNLHCTAYKILMLKTIDEEWVKDEDETNEVIRLTQNYPWTPLG